jgi:hypothetical protein
MEKVDVDPYSALHTVIFRSHFEDNPMPLLSDTPPLIRLTSVKYADGTSTIGNTDDVARIAAELFDQDGDIPNFAGLSALMVTWGQFIDHDLSLTRDASGEFVQVSGLVAPFQRSVFDPNSGSSAENPRMAVNEITATMDASMIYGSTEARTSALRAFEGGWLKNGQLTVAGRELLPLSSDENFMAGTGAAEGPVFLAGDICANENALLTALHTVFAREHNYWAVQLAKEYPAWEDEALFQAARAIVEYEVQSITYRDWISKLLVDAPLSASPAAPTDDRAGQVSVEFSTAAYRIGHTMISSDVRLIDESGTASRDDALLVRDIFFNPDLLREGHLDDLLRGQMATIAQEVDGKLIDDLNFFLRAPNGLTGFSLAALNILRGRDHGLDSYLGARAQLLGDIDVSAIDPADFSVITTVPDLQAALAAVYDSVHDVDLWVGGLIEDRPDGAQVGPLFTYILADQFFRTRAADSSFMQLPDMLSTDILAKVQSTTIRDVILRNTDITALQDDPFLAMDRLPGTDGIDTLTGTGAGEMIFGLWGDDVITAGAGDDLVFGGEGTDVAVHSGARSAYWVAVQQDGVQVADKRVAGDGTDRLSDVETLSFLDGDWSVASVSNVFDLSSDEICDLIELYIAYFDRAPDTTGLIFWASVLSNGMPLEEIAAYFHEGAETRLSYPDPSDTVGFVSSVYHHALGREADRDGLDFWVSVLDTGAVAQADFVMHFLDGVNVPAPSDASIEFLDQRAADGAFLKDKTELGLYFSLIKGMDDVADAQTVMGMYDGSQASLMEAAGQVNIMFDAAMAPDSDAMLLSLIGVVDDPFAGLIG